MLPKIKVFLHILAFYAAFLTALILWAFWPDKASQFYVHPCSGGYCVYAATVARDDVRITGPMKLVDAVDLTEKLNLSINGNWAAK